MTVRKRDLIALFAARYLSRFARFFPREVNRLIDRIADASLRNISDSAYNKEDQ